MIPRRIPVKNTDEWGVRPEGAFFALVIAALHRQEQLDAGKDWNCQCRCCTWARTQ